MLLFIQESSTKNLTILVYIQIKVEALIDFCIFELLLRNGYEQWKMTCEMISQSQESAIDYQVDTGHEEYTHNENQYEESRDI